MLIAQRPLLGAAVMLALPLGSQSGAQANLQIIPIFGSSITSNSNAVAIEGAIDTAISTLDGLFGNNITIDVNFTYSPAAAGNLLSTNTYLYGYSYSAYTAALRADSVANPGNTVLASAVANLSTGNVGPVVATGALAAALGLGPASNSVSTININSNQNFSFSSSVSSSQFDLIGGLEHELDEVLGGGGAGSWLNYYAHSCPGGAYCSYIGALDLYRYSAPGVRSYTGASNATAYFSVDGGRTKIVAFNQNSSGDFGDFWPPGSGAGQLIQDAFNSRGKDEAFTTSSPEYLMLEALGFDATSYTPAGSGPTVIPGHHHRGAADLISSIPEPSTWAMMLIGFAGLAFTGYRRTQKSRT
jgi:hypothetical protein